MKNKLKKLLQPAKLIAGLILLTGLTSCGGSGEKKSGSSEDSLDLTLFPVAYQEAYTRIDHGHDTLLIDNNPLFPEAALILKNHLLAFREIATQQHNSHTTCNNFITAIQIHFGIDTVGTDTLHLLYQPVSLCRKTGSNDTYNITNTTNYFYEYSYQTGFENATNASSYIQNYNSLINILRFDSSMGRENNTDDVRFVIYPFQEMVEVLTANNSDTLKLWNSTANIKMNSNNKTYTKHLLFLSPGRFSYPQNTEQLTNAVPFKGNFANHPHLCPPTCAEFTYKIK